MGVVLSNVLVWTARPQYSGGATSAPVAYLTRVPAHAEPIYARHYLDLPSSAAKASYMLSFSAATDINAGDQITAITLNDGVTTWPGDGGPNIAWMVNFIRVTGAGPLMTRVAYIQRITHGGTVHP